MSAAESDSALSESSQRLTNATNMSNSNHSPVQTSVPESREADLLTVAVQDFGPIGQATVNLRPLTIFVGRSNTGKTYFSKLIYAIHKTLSGFPQIPLVGGHHNPFGFIDSADSLMSEFKDSQQTENRHQKVKNIILKSLETSLLDGKEKILDEVGRCFGTTNILTTRRSHSTKKNFKIEISRKGDLIEIWKLCIGFKKRAASVDLRFNPNAIENNESLYKDLVSTIENQVDLTLSNSDDRFLDFIYFEFEDFIRKLAYPDSEEHQNSYFLPANRGGILESHKFVADVWLSQIPNLGLKHLPALQPLPKVSVDFIRTMLMIEGRTQGHLRRQMSNGPRPLEGVAKFIEDELIGGKLKASTSTEIAYPVFEYVPSNAKRSLKLDAASSMVSELAPIIVIARSHLEPYDLLIIEEPEAHLYPGALPLIAKCLARLVRSKVRVLITTHSDWLLKSLRNLILEGDLVELGLSSQNRSNDSYLLRSEVGAWEFSASSEFDGTKVKEITFDEFDGIEPSEIERISDSLYNESVTIRNKKNADYKRSD